jgi:glycosyltransferase involved in cell wall biosynthesis
VREYCFSLGSVLYHKNLNWIVRAAEKNPGRLFLVTGSLDLSSFAKDSKISKGSNIIMTGYLPDSQVKALMRHAAAFIHPSLSEGFGIPPMEAMSVGAKLLLSSASCLPEIYSDSAVYFDPLDYESIDMDRLLGTECSSADQVLDKYSWKKSAKRLRKLLIDI